MATRYWQPLVFVGLIALVGAVAVVLTFRGSGSTPELPIELTKPLLTLGGFNHEVGSIAYSLDGKLLAAADGKIVKVWDARTGREMVSFEAEMRQGLAFSPESKRLVLATWRDQVRDARTGKPILNLDRVNTGISTIAASPDGRWIALGNGRMFFGPPVNRNAGNPDLPPEMVPQRREMGTIEVFDANTGKLVREMDTPGKRIVTSLAFSVDGSRVAAVTRAAAGEVVSMWDVSTGREVVNLAGAGNRLEVIAFSPDGALVASVACGFPEPEPRRTTEKTDSTPRPPMEPVVLAPPRKEHEWGPGLGRVQVWHATTGQDRCLLPGYYDLPRCLAFSPNGKYLALGTAETTARVWDIATQQVVLRLTRHAKDVWAVAFSPDGKQIASASGGSGHPGEVRVWHVAAYLKPQL